MARELYDYTGLSTATAQHNKTLTLSPSIIGGSPVRESARKLVTIHRSVNGKNEERIGRHGVGEFDWWIGINYNSLSQSDAQTLLDYWFDSDYGDGPMYTFYFTSPDGHTYVVRFDQDTFHVDMLRQYVIDGRRGFGVLKFACLGKKAE